MKKLTVRKELMIMFSVLVCACGNDKDGDLGTNTGNGAFQTAINSYVRTMPSVKQIDPFSERKVAESKPASFEYAFKIQEQVQIRSSMNKRKSLKNNFFSRMIRTFSILVHCFERRVWLKESMIPLKPSALQLYFQPTFLAVPTPQ